MQRLARSFVRVTAVAILLHFATNTTVMAVTFTVQQEVLELSGAIKQGDGESFEKLLSPAIQVIRIRSPGGSLPDALKIGKAIHAQGLSLHVAGVCASACAQLILPSAKVVRIDRGSVIALHAAAEGAVMSAEREGALAQLPERVLETFLPAYQGLQREISSHLEGIGVSREAMDFMYRLTSTTSIDVSFTESPGATVNVHLSGRKNPVCRVWLLNRETIAAFGVSAVNWSSAGRLKAALVLGENHDQIYDGPVLSSETLSSASSCATARRLASASGTR